MLLFTALSALLIAASLSNNEQRDGQEYLFRLRAIDSKGDVDAYRDGDSEIHAGDLQRDERVQRYSNETFIGVKHRKKMSHTSKRTRGADDYENTSVSKYHRRRRRPGYDDEGEDVNIPNDCERRRPAKNRRRPSYNKRRRNGAYYDEECLKCGMMIGGSRLQVGQLDDLVIDGTVVQPMYKYPWIVAIIRPIQGYFCGGAIISATFVLTAFHCLTHYERKRNPECQKDGPLPEVCFFKPEEITVGLLPEKQRWRHREVKVAEVIPYSLPGKAKYLHDIGLIRLAAPLKCDKLASPICLPKTDLNNMNGTLIIAGFGKSSVAGPPGPRGVLREGVVKQIPIKVCKEMYKAIPNDPKDIICVIGTETNQSACKGDSGTSILVNLALKFTVLVSHLGIRKLNANLACLLSMRKSSVIWTGSKAM
ncbi:Serine protease 55 like protein [Argiope bruennichi]|uniref:Serine protease 55 like protein n=1 Tax=Argiope bruennichi TaxID=94029 RepID=A0A8T0FDS0_ARGBR|nr:Serine protease 55 like protein [Argiope bruennichi]